MRIEIKPFLELIYKFPRHIYRGLAPDAARMWMDVNA